MQNISPISKKKAASKKTAEATTDIVTEATESVAENNLEETINALLNKKLTSRLSPIKKQLKEAEDNISQGCETLMKLSESTNKRITQCEEDMPGKNATIVVFSGEFDKLMAAFIIATGAASMGLEVTMFFTFWGLTALKKKTEFKGKPVVEKMMSMMMPDGWDDASTSSMNMLGMGPAFFKTVMDSKGVESLPNLIKTALELEVKLVACEMSMNVMGYRHSEFIDGVELAGVMQYIAVSKDSRMTLFI
jgi:peroxiredoxin family protein